MTVETDHDLDIVIESEIAKKPPCEGELHPSGTYGHVPGEHAAFIVGKKCGHTLLMCTGWVLGAQARTTFTHLVCKHCNVRTNVEDLVFVPLEMD